MLYEKWRLIGRSRKEEANLYSVTNAQIAQMLSEILRSKLEKPNEIIPAKPTDFLPYRTENPLGLSKETAEIIVGAIYEDNMSPVMQSILTEAKDLYETIMTLGKAKKREEL